MTKKEELSQITKEIEESLIESWYVKNEFTDNEKLESKGIMSESMGLVSLLLLVISRDENDRLTEEKQKKINDIVSKELEYVSGEIEGKGFSAEPLVSAKRTPFFDKEHGYTDTVTWVLSAYTLIRYSQRKKLISLTADEQSKLFKGLSSCLSLIICSQQSEGTWGFMTDKDSIKSLYFTYTVSVSLADFFDYIIGEIQSIESPGSNLGFDFHDTELIEYLDEDLNLNVEETLIAVRKKTAKWLVLNCLPQLPLLAECEDDLKKERTDRSESEREALYKAKCEKLGMWTQQIKDENFKDEYFKEVNFFNLYYVYYIIDMMTITMSDEMFKDLISSDDGMTALKDSYGQLMNSVEYDYFFNSNRNDLYESLYKGYIEQSIHSARNNFMIASRTGKKFWDSSESELIINWQYKNNEKGRDISTQIGRALNKNNIADPALLPMALRVNTCYCYYISLEKDFSLERLYRMILESRANESDSDLCKIHLWDSIFYNLSITERCIEALVDYKDYVIKFENESTVPSEASRIDVGMIGDGKSDIDVAIEKKIEEYLSARIGSSVVSESPDPLSMDKYQFKKLADEYLFDILSDIECAVNINDNCDSKSIPYSVLACFDRLSIELIYRGAKQSKSYTENEGLSNGVSNRFKTLIDRRNDLYHEILKDTESTNNNFVDLYKKLVLR